MKKKQTSKKPLSANDGNAMLADSKNGGVEKMRRWCPNCKMETTQYVKLYNPDNAEEGEVWECHYCEENTGWASW